MQGIVGKKVGMTQIFENGKLVPVTVIQAGPNYVLQKKKYYWYARQKTTTK